MKTITINNENRFFEAFTPQREEIRKEWDKKRKSGLKLDWIDFVSQKEILHQKIIRISDSLKIPFSQVQKIYSVYEIETIFNDMYLINAVFKIDIEKHLI